MAESIWDTNGVEWVRGTELARRIGVGQAQINSLMKKPIEQGKSVGRIPEAYMDETKHMRYPVKNCIVPTRFPRSYAAINDWFMTKEDFYNLDDELREEVMRNYWKEFGFDSPNGDAEDAPQESEEGISQAEENLRAIEPSEPEGDTEEETTREQDSQESERQDGWIYTDTYQGPDRRQSTQTLERPQTVRETSSNNGNAVASEKEDKLEKVVDKENLRKQGIDLDALEESDDVEGFGIVVFFRK